MKNIKLLVVRICEIYANYVSVNLGYLKITFAIFPKFSYKIYEIYNTQFSKFTKFDPQFEKFTKI